MDTWWAQIASTVIKEFSDLSDVGQATRLVLRLTVAAVLGGLLGMEREHKGKAAGIRTHMLVAMGSALFVMLSQQSGIAPADMSRVIQGLIAGIGFLGAGTILKGEEPNKVQGLTTAAGIWMTSAIGMAAGLGLEVTAVLSTLLALVIFAVVPWMIDTRDDNTDKHSENFNNGKPNPARSRNPNPADNNDSPNDSPGDNPSDPSKNM